MITLLLPLTPYLLSAHDVHQTDDQIKHANICNGMLYSGLV